MKKRIIAILASVMAVTMLTAFTDVPKKHWAFDGISQAQSLGLIKGVTAQTFEPSLTINKQEMAVIIYRMHDLITSSDMGDLERYEPDMDGIKSAGIDSWAAQELTYGLKNSFWTLSDFSLDGGGDTDASRELIAKWYVNVAGFKNFGLRVLPYADADKISPEYYGYVDSLYKYGIMRGAEGRFYPKEGIERAEAAVSAVRLFLEKQALHGRIYEEPVVFIQGSIQNLNSEERSFSIDGKFVNIDSDAVMLIDGQVADFSNLASYTGKRLSVSSVISEDNSDKVIIQSKPVSISGVCKKVVLYNEGVHAADPFSIAEIEIQGKTFDFVINSDTEILRESLLTGDVRMITDGIYILEIK